MDFYKIKSRETKEGLEVYPDFKVTRSKDLMVQGRAFYAIWDSTVGLWSQDEYRVQSLIDTQLMERVEELRKKHPETDVYPKLLSDFSSNSWMQFRKYVGHISDSSHPLDENLTFSNTEVKQHDYVSRRLPYPIERGDISAWDELIGTLYDPSERAKLEWAVGAIVSGDAKDIQKFLVLYGAAGAGKSTILNIIQKLFAGYYTTFEAKALTQNSNAFATEVFKGNPLVAIQHDGDLSKIEDNTKLNSIVSHEEMTMNEKFKPSYTARINAFLFMGTNKPVKITDAKSGIIRRLIDVVPSGRKLAPNHYHTVMNQIGFELGAIAQHCLDVYSEMGKNYYNGYRPVEMMLQTDVFYNYIEYAFDVFKEQDGATLNQAYELYKLYCDESNVEYKLAKYKFREELRNYFDTFEDRAELPDGTRVRSWYGGFQTETFRPPVKEEPMYSLVLDQTTSIFDEEMSERAAQLANQYETPSKKWDEVTTVLSDIDTTQIHYVKPPLNHIVIDFDLKGDDGEKSVEKNLEAASKWPSTYGEFSKSGSGVHLHYNWAGDVSELSSLYSEGIEVKVFAGGSSLRRRLTLCNRTPVATLNSGLPLKEKKVINVDAVQSEKALRNLIERNLRKEIHPGTKPSIDFIHKILEDAYSSGLQYNVSDMKGKILAFANNSSNQALQCIKIMKTMKFESEGEAAVVETGDDKPVFFDCEVYPNLFLISFKKEDSPHITRLVNPTAQEVENLVKFKLIGFNCRRYDNHILYGAMMGFNNEQLYNLSQKIINNTPGALFGEAYELSYADIYDYSSKKQSLKKFEIELGIKHMEMDIPWDQPVDKELWGKVGEYCDNDVLATEAVHKAREQDFIARKVLAELSGLSVNTTTRKHATKILFGGERNPQGQFVYTDLSEMFPGYSFEMGKSSYKGEDPSEGGYVYAEPGIYKNVAVLDVASMHPTSIEQLNLFGPYTKQFSEIKQARVHIKHGDYERAGKMLGGKLAPYLKDKNDSVALSNALKLVINSIYGYTAASFDNPFRDIRNVDNIVAKRGALFMIDLKEFVQEKGYTVVHIKTDSIKVADADQYIIDEITAFGTAYGYDFEHETTYEKMTLVNKAVYIAKDGDHWEATGAQFQHPYVYKSMFTRDEIAFDDLCETKQVSKGHIYLDFRPEDDDTPMFLDDREARFIGRIGRFTPVTEGGARLIRMVDEHAHAVTGTKGYRWLESEMVENMGKEKHIDMSYFDGLVTEAEESINQYGDLAWFLDS